ncbi:SulA-like leucine-rich domain-containing protein [Pseudoalteromonas fenneropenaei]|uniref:SulA-like leucine-rich domain-containing protein n=1 Tax=Pseudoalteromonas fenneropenaei TaxID=1737459 RepID=A0ABV7CIL8_9GAMM
MLQSISVTRIKSYNAASEPVVQVIHTEDEISASLELLKVLHSCNQKQGWTLLIAPDNVPNKAMLQSCSIDSSKLLVIRQKHLVNLPYVLNSALHNGNFAAVITWTDIVSPSQLDALALTTQSKAQLYCFTRTRHTATPDSLLMC